MPQLCFKDKVLVYEAQGDRVSGWIKHTAAARRIYEGSAVVCARDRADTVIAIRAVIVAKQAKDLQSVRPGSFGIHRQHVESGEYSLNGGVVFSHKNPLPMLSRGEKCAA
jgi:hypothetical protein